MLVTLRDQVWIPEDDSLRFKLILEHHDQPFYGHWALQKTLQLVQSYYYWPTMKQDIEHVVQTCNVCQRAQIAKTRNQAPIRFIEAQYPWEVITIDFVSGFASTKRKHTAICVMCDRFTQMVHCESCHDHATAKEAAHIVMRQVFAQHGCPRIILSDRGTQFDSELWKYI